MRGGCGATPLPSLAADMSHPPTALPSLMANHFGIIFTDSGAHLGAAWCLKSCWLTRRVRSADPPREVKQWEMPPSGFSLCMLGASRRFEKNSRVGREVFGLMFVLVRPPYFPLGPFLTSPFFPSPLFVVFLWGQPWGAQGKRLPQRRIKQPATMNESASPGSQHLILQLVHFPYLGT